MRFAVVGFISALSVATAALGAAGDGLAIQGNRVNVRADASAGSPVLLQLDRGDRVVELDRRGEWVRVEVPQHGGRRGWVHSSLVAAVAGDAPPAAEARGEAPEARNEAPAVEARGEASRTGPVPLFADRRPAAGDAAPAAEVPAAEAGGPAIEIEAMGVRIRGGPTTRAPVIAKLDRGARLPQVGQRGNWLRVRLDDGQVGWVHNSLTSTVEGGAPATTAAAPSPGRQEPTTVRPTPQAPETAAAEEEAGEEPAAAETAAAEPAPAAAGEERPPATFATEGRPRLEVAATTVSLRREPSRLAPVVTRLERGSEVVELDRREEWVEVGVVAPDGARGWVHGSLVSPVEAGATAAAEQETEQEPGEEAEETVAAAPAAEQRVAAGTPAVEEEEGADEATAAEPRAITGNRVNIRGGPSTRNAVVAQLNRGAEVFELDRQGDWVRIALGRPGGREGWVHESLVAPRVAAAPAPEEKAPEGSRVAEARADEAGGGGDKFDRFKSTVEHLNERVRRAAGVDVFAEVEEVGEGTVELTATEAWLAAPEAARRANLDTLFRLWDSVHDPDQPIVVRIIDDAGEVAMEKRRDEPPAAAGRRPPTAGG